MANWLNKYEQGGLVLKKKTKDNFGKKANPNDVKASVGPDFVGLGYNTKGRDYSPAWGGQFQDGGKLTLPEAIVYGHKDPSTKAYFNKVRAIAENYQDKNFWLSPLAGYHTLEQMHSKYGAPKINTIGEDDRAHYEPFTDVMSIPNPTKFNGGNETMDIFLEELAHKVQKNKKGIIGISTKQLTKDYLNTLKNIDSSSIFTKQGWIDAYEKNYTTPGTLENEAHSVISPKLKEEYRDIRSKNFDRLYGDMAMGGSLPGAVGFTYARVAGSAPANGKYTKKTKASAQNGSVIKDDMGQWAHPGEVTEIGSNDITMQGVDYPVLGVSDTGDTQMMYPDQDYKFDGEKVTEFPMAQNGRRLPDVTVTSKADPRLKAYQDSLNLYNASINMGKKGAEALAKDYYKNDLEEVKKGNTTKAEADRRYKSNLEFYNQVLVDPITKGTKPRFGGLYKYDKNADDRIVIEEDILNKGMHNYLTDNDRIEKGYYKQTLESYKDFKKLNKKIKPIKYLGHAELFPIPVYKKPVQPVKYQKPEPAPVVAQQPTRQQPAPQPKPLYEYEGEQVMVPVPSGGGGSMVGVKKKDGTIEYIKPEDYQRMGVPKYGQDYIKSKQKMKEGGWLNKYK